MKDFIKMLLTQPDTNSRFIYLVHGVASSVAVIVLSVAFLFAKDRTGFPVMVTAAAGGGVGASVGRMMTKMGGKKSAETTSDDKA